MGNWMRMGPTPIVGWGILVTVAAVSLAGQARGGGDPKPTTIATAAASWSWKPTSWLVTSGGRSPGRVSVGGDPLFAWMIRPDWSEPTVGEGSQGLVWQKSGALPQGGPDLRFSAAYTKLELPASRVAFLEAGGHGSAFVNGELRAGNPYGYEWARVPVLLKAGVNHLVVTAGRGPVRFQLTECPAEPYMETGDATLPDLRRGADMGRAPLWGAVVVGNPTAERLSRLSIEVRSGSRRIRTAVPPLLPFSVRKCPIRLPEVAPKTGSEQNVELALLSGRRPTATQKFKLRVREAQQTYRQTFRSNIDDSVQYFAVNPAGSPGPGQALFLSLHGASVEAIGQADAYASKSWGHLVAPTNRRPFGFDWEDWGRWDALEVLDLAQSALKTDPQRVYLTGHSMGGHGTWHVGVTQPDRFAAIGPSAGWISFWSYAGGGPRNPGANGAAELLQRATNPSDTLALANNYSGLGIYSLHGDADDNVPVSEMRRMKEVLTGFHRDWQMHEQPGAGHWWDASPEPGADCVDWAPLFDFFARRRRPEPQSIVRVQFATMNPDVSSRRDWVEVLQQQRSLLKSEVSLRFDPHRRFFQGNTVNVQLMRLRATRFPGSAPVTASVDGQNLPPVEPKGDLFLRFRLGRWTWSEAPASTEKQPGRSGPFKEAFRNRMVMVFGTRGSTEENRWSIQRARYDAENFWYRGNGSVDVVPDSEFLADAENYAGRAVILYGNAQTNAAFSRVLGENVVQVTRSDVRIGNRRLTGSKLTVLLVRPRADDPSALVGVVGGTGLEGLRASDRLPIFVSGTAYPDVLCLDSGFLLSAPGALKAAGYFGTGWDVDSGEWAWQ